MISTDQQKKLEQLKAAGRMTRGNDPANSNTPQPEPIANPVPAPIRPMAPPLRPMTSSFALVSVPAKPDDRKIKGTILKYRKSKWIAGGRELAAGTRVLVRSVLESQCIFAGQEIIYEIFREEGLPFPERDEVAALPFPRDEVDAEYEEQWPELVTLDQSQWPLGPSGQPSDPVQHTFYLWLFAQADRSEYTFISSTWGGLHAVRRLSSQIAYEEELRGGGPPFFALVELATITRKSRRYDEVLEPDFPVKEWVGYNMRPLPKLDLDDSIAF
jgi:hypothetical protein